MRYGPVETCDICKEHKRVIGIGNERLSRVSLIARIAAAAVAGDLKTDPNLAVDAAERWLGYGDMGDSTPREVAHFALRILEDTAAKRDAQAAELAEHQRDDHGIFTEPAAVELAPGVELVVQPNAAPTA